MTDVGDNKFELVFSWAFAECNKLKIKTVIKTTFHWMLKD